MVTVFTPTYNRKILLQELKKSLDKQIDIDFEWIIIDDGSTDNTTEVVNQWAKDTKYSVKYYKQKNSGKHIAFNKAVEMASGDIFICVDSDDQLTQNAIEKIKSEFHKASLMDIGVVSPRIDKCGKVNNNWKKIDSQRVDIIDLKEVYGIVESAIAIRTSVLKKNTPFGKFENEKFLPEGWLYLDLCYQGKFLVDSEGYYISEYQETGLTKNLWKHWKNNHHGVLATLQKKYEVSRKYDFLKRESIQTKIILNMGSLCFAVSINVLENTPSKMKSLALLAPSWVIYKIRYKNV